MIIVSQERNMTTECLELEIIDREIGFAIYSYGLCEDIGIYKTEERAKEVLREIVDTFGIREIRNATYQYADLAIKSRKYSIYEMPES